MFTEITFADVSHFLWCIQLINFELKLMTLVIIVQFYTFIKKTHNPLQTIFLQSQ